MATNSDDPFDLQRFVDAQEGVYGNALRELKTGRKQSHWMWFVFPQVAGLGHSPMARTYAIRSLAEAKAYLGHGVLGPRLIECTRLASAVPGRSVKTVFGSPDDMKFRSSMTLFSEAADDPAVFEEALARYFANKRDERTLEILAR